MIGHGWRALPDFTAGEPFQYWPFLTLAHNCRTGGDVGIPADHRARQQCGAGADGGVVADSDLADVEQIAVDPVTGQVDLGSTRTAVAEGQHAGDRRGGMQIDPLPTGITQCPCVIDQPRCTGLVLGSAGFGGVRPARRAGAGSRPGGRCPA